MTVNFLPVGHTHEDIDRRFSRISVSMRDQKVITLSDLHHFLKVSQSEKMDAYVARVLGMNNFSRALESQKKVTANVDGLSTYRKFVFERDLESDYDVTPDLYVVSCKAGHKMTDRRSTWVTLPRRSGFAGVFLKGIPDLRISPPISMKQYTKKELVEFEKRVNSTEIRITSSEKTLALSAELERLKSVLTAKPDWKLQRLFDLAGGDRDEDEAEDMEPDMEPTHSDQLTYSEGEMVVVNCGSKATSVTPF